MILSNQLLWANESDNVITESKPTATVTVTEREVSAKCKITRNGKETAGIDDECTNILKDVFSSLRQQTQAAKQ